MEKIQTDTHVLYVFCSPRGCLSYLISTNTNEGIVIDPSVEVGNAYARALAENTVRLRTIIDTHTHADHISAYRELKRATDAKYLMHKNAPSSHIDRRLNDGDSISTGNVTLQVLHTPGHSSDSITLRLSDTLFTADTLLIGGTGRTDLRPDSSSAELYDSLWQKILPLGDHVRFYPGHDYRGKSSSTLGEERKTNPRIQLSREEFIKVLDAHHPPKPELFEEAIERNSE